MFAAFSLNVALIMLAGAQQHNHGEVSLQNYAKPVASKQSAAYCLFSNFTDSCICTQTDESDPLTIPLHSHICTDFTPDWQKEAQ